MQKIYVDLKNTNNLLLEKLKSQNNIQEISLNIILLENHRDEILQLTNEFNEGNYVNIKNFEDCVIKVYRSFAALNNY